MSVGLRTRLVVTVGVLLLATAAGGGVGWAVGALADSTAPNTVAVCVTNNGGQLRVVSSTSQCRPNEHPLVLETAVAGGQTAFTVNCAAGQRIGDVLNQVSAGTRPVTITVTGICTEAVQINRDNVTLTVPMGPGGKGGIAAPGPGSAPLIITGRRIQLNGLSLTGGSTGIFTGVGASFAATGVQVGGAQTGITLSQATTAELDRVTVSGSAATGIEMQTGSTLTGNDLAITGSGWTGLHVWNNSTANIGSGSITHNGHGGVIVQDGGAAVLGGQISDNAVGGVTSMEGSHVSLSDASIHNNDYWGVAISGGSRVAFGDRNSISMNTGSGVTVSDESIGVFQNGSDTNSITGNTGWGITCAGPPAVAMIANTPGLVSGNQAGQVNCPITS